MRKLLISLLFLLIPSAASARSSDCEGDDGARRCRALRCEPLEHFAGPFLLAPGRECHGWRLDVEGIQQSRETSAGSQSAKISSSGVGLELFTYLRRPAVQDGSRQRMLDYYGFVSLRACCSSARAHASNSVFAGATGPSSSASSFCCQGWWRSGSRSSRRASPCVSIQADWVRTQFPNGTSNVQNNIQVGTGVVIHFR